MKVTDQILSVTSLIAVGLTYEGVMDPAVLRFLVASAGQVRRVSHSGSITPRETGPDTLRFVAQAQCWN